MQAMVDIISVPGEKSPFTAPDTPSAEAVVEALQKSVEQGPESKEPGPEDDIVQAGETTPVQAMQVLPSKRGGTEAALNDEVSVHVEKILEEGLGPLYASLPENAKPIFKRKGEEAANQISAMVRSLKLEVSKVVRLIRDWLLIIPKVNKYFLEQEAKIKTDMLIEFVEAKKEDLAKQP